MAFGLLIDRRKLNKRNHVVDVFRSQGALSKVRAREACGYSMDTLINIFDSLQEEGYILPAPPASSPATEDAPAASAPEPAPAQAPPQAPDGAAQPDSGAAPAPSAEAKAPKRPKGRPAELFRLNDEREAYLGVTFNLGGIHSVLVSFSGAVLALRSDEWSGVADQASFEALLDRHLEAFIEENRSRLPAVRRIGLALPGQLDAEKRILKHYGLMPFLKDADVGALVARRLPDLPLITRHNVAGMARVCLKDSALSQSYARILFVSARAGAAHALIQDGKVVLDQGEMGHLRVAASQKRCECGRLGCLDSVFSAREIRAFFPGMSGAQIASALAREEAEGGAALRSRIEPPYLAFCEALLDLCAAFSPDLVLMSGELLAILPDPAAWIRRWIGGMVDLDKPPAWFPAEFAYRLTGAEAAAVGLCYALIEEDWAWQPDRAEGDGAS